MMPSLGCEFYDDLRVVNMRNSNDLVVDKAPDFEARVKPLLTMLSMEQLLCGLDRFVIFIGDKPGAGRTFFMEELYRRYPHQIGILPLYQTREERDGEYNGIHGYFLGSGPEAEAEFKDMEDGGQFFQSFRLGIGEREKLAGIAKKTLQRALRSPKYWLIDMPAYAVARFVGIFNRTKVVWITTPLDDLVINQLERGLSELDCHWQVETIGTAEPAPITPLFQRIENRRSWTESNIDLLKRFILEGNLSKQPDPSDDIQLSLEGHPEN